MRTTEEISPVELSFIVAAIRRYLWVIYLTALLGLAAGLLIPATRAESWSATSRLIVRPPATEATDQPTQGDPRYIESQRAVIESEDLANKVAIELGLTFADVENALTVESDASSDVITLTAEAPTEELAIELANTFADIYLLDRASVIVQRNTRLIGIIDGQLETLNIERDQITEALLALPREPDTDQDVILLNTSSQRLNTIDSQIGTLTDQRSTLELGSESTVRDEVAETAARAIEQGTNSPLLTVAGTFAGIVLGVAVVVTYAGTSGRLLDTVAVEEALGTPVVGVFSRASSVLPGQRRIKTPVSALEALPDSCSGVIDELCVRTEAAAPGPGTLLVVVAGSQSPAATTTTALAMAGRLSLTGTRVLVIDADFADPRVTDSLVGEHPGITDLLDEREAIEDMSLFGPNGKGNGVATSRRTTSLAHLTLTHEQTRVGVIGIGTRTDRRTIQRSDEDFLIAALRSADADVVLVDVGPILKSAASVRLAQAADVTVLAVPYRRQDVEPLRVVRRLLSESNSTVLPIATEPR